MTALMDATDPKRTGVTLDQIIVLMNYGQQIPQVQALYKMQAQAIFMCFDFDGDGIVSKEEYSAMLKPLGISDDDIDVGFKAIDANKDGKISPDEFTDALLNYTN